MNRFGLIRLLCGAILLAVALVGVVAISWPRRAVTAPRESARTLVVRRATFARTIRVGGTTEAVRSSAAIAPRLAGQSSPTLVITKLVSGGTRVNASDILVQFDPQEQIQYAFDRRTDYQDLEQQIRRLEAEQAAQLAADETAVRQAENDVGRAELQVRTNRVLPAIEAAKNTLALEEAQARLTQVRQARALRQRTAAADMKVLQIRLERSERAMLHAEHNTGLMVVRAPFEGLAVVQPAFKGSQMTELQEGDEVRPGMPIVNVVDPSRMQVRARVSQVDGGSVVVGQEARVALDAYPGLTFTGHVVRFAPLAIVSSLTPAVRGFVAVIAVEGSHPNLMPDLSAAVDITVDNVDNALTVPREAVVIEPGGAFVALKHGNLFERQKIVLGAVSADQAIVTSGLTEGAVLARRPKEAW